MNATDPRPPRFRTFASLGCTLLLLLQACSPSSPATSAPTGTPTQPAAIPVSTNLVELVQADRTVPIVGTLFAKDEATIGAEVEGRVERTAAEFGDRVTKGQIIALIDTATYQTHLEQAEATLARAHATATNSAHDLQRVQELARTGVASPSALDKAQADTLQAQADVRVAESALNLARLNMEKSRVRAPFDGAIADRIATTGDYLKTGEPMFRVVNDALLKYIVQVPERYAPLVSKQQSVRFQVDAWPGETFEAPVYLISPQVTTTTRGFSFGALVTNSNLRLRANTYARGELILERNVTTPVVPIEAVTQSAGLTRVFVLTDNIAHARAVTLGRLLNGRQEILDGLKPGEAIATSSLSSLYEGAHIRIKPASTPGAATITPPTR